MSSKAATQGERITAIEVELRKDRDRLMARLDKMEAHMSEHFEKQDERLSEVERRLSGYENKGKGILIGVGITSAGLGAGALAIFERIWGVFK